MRMSSSVVMVTTLKPSPKTKAALFVVSSQMANAQRLISPPFFLDHERSFSISPRFVFEAPLVLLGRGEKADYEA